jgi:hypothetical protein
MNKRIQGLMMGTVLCFAFGAANGVKAQDSGHDQTTTTQETTTTNTTTESGDTMADMHKGMDMESCMKSGKTEMDCKKMMKNAKMMDHMGKGKAGKTGKSKTKTGKTTSKNTETETETHTEHH